MKIVFTNDTIYGYATDAAVTGGAERQQWLLARALAAAGWAVTVGVHEALAAGERCSIDGVTFVGIGRGHIGLGREHIHLIWYRFLASEQPEWWYWRCANHLLGSAVEVAKLARVRTIFAAAVDGDVRPHRALFRRSYWWPLYAWGLARTDKILVQHTGQLAALASRWRPKASIVPSIAGELAAVKPHEERDQYVAWVAMLRQPKRPDLLLEIARKLPDVRFVVCGGPTPFASPPGYSERIVAALQAQPNIVFLGAVAPQKARQIIANAAMLLSTSDLEGFPNTFLEAWSSGTPVISLHIDPNRIIEQQELGTVPGTTERATADILALMGAPQLRDDMAARARQYVAATHSEAAVVAAFEGAIEPAQRGRPRGASSRNHTTVED